MSTIEDEIRRLHDAGDLAGATTAALEGYGREVFGFLIATLRTEDDASEAFSMLAEDVWSGIGAFEWRASFRTWLYRLARHAAARHARSPHARRERNVPLSQAGEIAARVRTRTLAHLRTDVKDRFVQLRRTLEPEDQMLLVLRVDRGLSWDEVVRVLDDTVDEAELARASARWRKRFQLVKEDLRLRAQKAGLLEGD